VLSLYEKPYEPKEPVVCHEHGDSQPQGLAASCKLGPIVRAYPTTKTIHLAMDNWNTHT